MNLKISGHHLELTPSLREYVQNKLERIKRHFDNVIDISVTLSVDALTEKEKRQRVEINLHARGKDFHVESEAQDMYAAIDLLMDKLDRQVLKHKGRIKDHQHEGIRRYEGPTAEIA